MKILVPIDFSDCALNALKYAIELGIATQSELILFHAYHPPMGSQDSYFIDKPMIDHEKKLIKSKMRQLSVDTPKLDQISHSYLIKLAFAVDGIKKTIKEYNIDLVVMGTHGAHNAGDEVFGTNTYGVIKQAACPVLAVPASFQKFQLNNMAFAVDFYPTENHPSLEFLKMLARTFKATVHLLHVNPHPVTITVEQGEEALAFDHMLQDIPHTFSYIEEFDVEKGIAHYVKNFHMDILVILPEKQIAFMSLFRKCITRQVALHTHIPLLTLPPVNTQDN